jgi:predicted amino acid racemase
MKELTYLHCQNIKLSDIGNNFFCYLKKHKNTPAIFIILDHQKEKLEMIENIEKLHS